MGKGDWRQRMEQRLGRSLPDHIWQWAVEDELAREVLDDDEDYLLERLRIFLARDRQSVAVAAAPDAAGKMPPPQAQRTGPHAATLEPYSQLRAEVFSRAITALVATAPEVKAFRESVLGGVLHAEAARRFMHSEAIRHLSRGSFAEYGIPFVGHESRVTERRREPGRWTGLTGETIKLFVNPPGIELLYLHGATDIDSTYPTMKLPERARSDNTFGDSLDVLEGSVLDDLRKLADWLARVYPWSAPDAAWFALTGEATSIPAVTWSAKLKPGSDHFHLTISVTAEAWVSPEAVKRAYRDAQAQLVGKRIRSMERGAELLRFVQTQAQGGQRPPWRRLVKRWNEQHPPERHYEGRHAARRFSRDYHRAESRLLFPDYDCFTDVPRGYPRGRARPAYSSSALWRPADVQADGAESRP